MKTQELSDHLLTIAKLKTCAQDASFSIRAFEFAARQLMMHLPEEVSSNDSFDDITGIGKNIKQVIRQYFESSSSHYYTELAKRYPVRCLDLTKVNGIGPRNALRLYQAGIHSFEHLTKLAREKKLDGLLTEKLRQKVLETAKNEQSKLPKEHYDRSQSLVSSTSLSNS